MRIAGRVSTADQLLPPDEAQLFEQMWTSAMGRAFPVKGPLKRVDATQMAKDLLRRRLRREELLEPEAA